MRLVILALMVVCLNCSAVLAGPIQYDFTGQVARLDDTVGWYSDNWFNYGYTDNIALWSRPSYNTLGGGFQFTVSNTTYLANAIFDLTLYPSTSVPSDDYLLSMGELTGFTVGIRSNTNWENNGTVSAMEIPGDLLAESSYVSIDWQDLDWNSSNQLNSTILSSYSTPALDIWLDPGVYWLTLEGGGPIQTGVTNSVLTGTSEVPEPSTLFLMGAGVFGLFAFKRKKNQKN